MSHSDTVKSSEPRHRLGYFLAITGIFLLSGQLWGLLGTVIGMIGAFNTMSEAGAADPSELSGFISFALTTTVVGMVCSIIGSLVSAIAVVFTGYRRRWFYSWAIGLSIVWCIGAFPLGLIPGLITISFFTSRRAEFN